MQRLHANAKLTPALRRLLVVRVRELGWRVTEAAGAAGVVRQTAYKWLSRFEAEGEAGLEDRSCRPRRLRRPTPRSLVQRMLRLRRRRKTAGEIAAETGVAASTVSRHLQAEGVASPGPWVTHYNHCRPHRAIGKIPPIARLRASRQ